MNNLKLTIIMLFILIASCKKEETSKTETKGDLPIADYGYNKKDNWIQVWDKSQNAESISWDFGDGIYSNSYNLSKAYSKSGSYTITLTAKNAAGSSNKQIVFNMNIPSDNGHLMVYVNGIDVLEEYINIYIGNSFLAKLDKFHYTSDIPICGSKGITTDLFKGAWFVRAEGGSGRVWNYTAYIKAGECTKIEIK